MLAVMASGYSHCHCAAYHQPSCVPDNGRHMLCATMVIGGDMTVALCCLCVCAVDGWIWLWTWQSACS